MLPSQTLLTADDESAETMHESPYHATAVHASANGIGAIPDVKRLNVKFSGEAYAELAALAQESGKTISDVVREAISLKRWYERSRREGWRILLERDGRVREVVTT